ncbi:hypothetical protein [Methanosarcina horonobensis]|uniref:hypothetical protein n=1 Tax=Methanosarcina horonobensis TaxID=418008 RepID=UPI000AA7B31D|nr:hypothetical protein [Methanosarcina horonobensis]
MLSNPHISCLIVCGKESDHFAGQSLLALAENGISILGGSKKDYRIRRSDSLS